MDFLLNDLSMAGQFQDFDSFRQAITRVMLIRKCILGHGGALHCHRSLTSAAVANGLVMQQAVNQLSEAERKALMQWVTQFGPHWEDARVHGATDYLEVGDVLVTDKALGEAAVCIYRGLSRQVVSFQPSQWMTSPITVKWTQDGGVSKDIPVPNHWELESVQRWLEANPTPIQSWKELGERSRAQFTRLTFSSDAFSPLKGETYKVGAAMGLHTRLDVLDKLVGCLNVNRTLNDEGLEIHRNHFTGDKAWFSDSSDGEKIQFKDDMRDSHPARPDEWLFCTWHGKVKTPQYRIHFTWPVLNDGKLYVVYVGPKITKR